MPQPAAFFVYTKNMFSVLFAKGLVGVQESALMVQATLLMLIVVIPVLGLLFFFAWRYRASNTAARYEPEWEHSALDELVWWAVPLEIILVLAAITWISTHRLDPHKPLSSSTPPIEVEVVALPWKWLFIYPQYGIATVNYLEIPAQVPINFAITADAPMNSFWIPSLGGQIYAMTGMVSPLSLIANEPGTYRGMSANYSGDGFADMAFNVQAVTKQSFDDWTASAHSASTSLTRAGYTALAKPGTSTPQTYGQVDTGLFSAILSTFDQPGSSGHHH